MQAMRETITIPTADGACPALVFRPDGDGPWPGVLLFMDGIGMRPAIHELGARLASAGYYVLVPDLFWRAGEYTAPDPAALFGDPAVRAAWSQKISAHGQPPLLMRDTRAFLDHLEQSPHVSPKKIGVTGYCMGGRLAITAAATYPDEIAAAAAYHPGGLVSDTAESPHLLAPKIKATVYVGAATEDASFTDAQRATLTQALADAGVDHTVELCPARHGWVPSDTPVHDTAQAERHWQTLLGLFDRTLRG
jgi:carboxymethylenebutenolidase